MLSLTEGRTQTIPHCLRRKASVTSSTNKLHKQPTKKYSKFIQRGTLVKFIHIKKKILKAQALLRVLEFSHYNKMKHFLCDWGSNGAEQALEIGL